MPIIRTYMCRRCAHSLEVTLDSSDYDAPPPKCPVCCARRMEQEFKPVAIAGNAAVNRDKARKMAEEIAATDYNVADMQIKGYEGERNKVRYKDLTPGAAASTWGATQQAISAAAAAGRQQRTTQWETGPIGSGLDVLQGMIKSGDQPDLIELSKKKSAKVW